MSDSATLPFRKMHGLGNDFVVLDGRIDPRPLALDPARVRAIADRRAGIGCDQLIVIATPSDNTADVRMLIFNADGSEVAACGNATRCVAWLAMTESGRDSVVIETRAGLLDAESRGTSLVAVDMGAARLDWREIPLNEAVDTLHLGLSVGPLSDPVAVSMGNPHAVFFVEDSEAIDLAAVGPDLEHHPIFPERANIEVASILPTTEAGRGRIRMRVWERGAGITPACGTGACATLVAAARRGLSPRRAELILDGGTLEIEWLPDDHVLMTGPVATSFTGLLDPALLS
ncbi:diaminopimelate epimerase [Magnetospirillum molischianum]|uniref:Diaminopimelate epimerase n=1 Tax=Magnetospirillum molischianum DSM 120 TaxID=1150626 RepID=H8FRJ6_MAGML|nr:diaminopimelate epimerase [Magnetospirillum molischianum]CCG40984.1 diaminopimelate epimerase [Magnetospirillum molischianum DSM 120]